MASFELPKSCVAKNLIQTLDDHKLLATCPERTKIAIHVPDESFVSCSALAFLSAWGSAQRAFGVRLTAIGHQGTLRYLSRMDLFRQLEIVVEAAGIEPAHCRTHQRLLRGSRGKSST